MHVDYFNITLNNFDDANQNIESECMLALNHIKTIAPVIDKVWQIENKNKARLNALQLAKEFTNRTKFIFITDNLSSKVEENFLPHENIETILAGDKAKLCETIAMSSERIAGIIVKAHCASLHYYKKVRELTSAEGAVMIWDQLDSKMNANDSLVKITKTSQPDLICFNLTTVIWIGSKKELFEFKSRQL